MATEVELKVDQGSRFLFRIEPRSDWFSRTDYPNYDGGWMVRDQKNSNVVLADLSDYVILDSASGQVILDLPANISSAFSWRGGAYDVELQHKTDPSKDARLIQGTITVDREVTR